MFFGEYTMSKLPFVLMAVFVATPLLAEETRHVEAHEHGVGQLDIAFEGDQIAIELHAPGADIVGFEYAAENAKDRAAIDEAVAILARPLDLFVLPEAAACSVLQASASLEIEDEHEEEHTGEVHEEHDDEDHADHTEFHAAYLLTCANSAALSKITFAYFETFPHALELEVQTISDAGSMAYEIMRDAPVLDLRNMF
jgi:uncharacterized protein DUF2796